MTYETASPQGQLSHILQFCLDWWELSELTVGTVRTDRPIGGFYIDTSTFEATGMRAEAGVTWRPYNHVGFFAGLHAIYADLDLGDEQIDDLLLWGPAVGMEVRF